MQKRLKTKALHNPWIETALKPRPRRLQEALLAVPTAARVRQPELRAAGPCRVWDFGYLTQAFGLRV